MVAGKMSPILRAIQEAESLTQAEVHVHLSHRWWERDPENKAKQWFRQMGLHNSPGGNSVLIYVNLRKKKLAVVAGEAANQKLTSGYWDKLIRFLHDDLHSTYFENAIAMSIRTLAYTLQKYFPVQSQ